MDASTGSGNIEKRRRLTIAELTEIIDGVAEKLKSKTVQSLALLAEQGAPAVIYQAKPKKCFSKAAKLEAPEKILSLVALNPEWGTKRLARALSGQGITLSRQSVHKILLKHNLNHLNMRKAWQATRTL